MDPHDQRIQDAASRLIIALRQARGIDSQAASDLRAALIGAAEAWASSNTIPKSTASLFVDLASGLESFRFAYSGSEAHAIEALALEIGDLVRQVVAVPGE
jgi:hypothetical protein